MSIIDIVLFVWIDGLCRIFNTDLDFFRFVMDVRHKVDNPTVYL